MGVEPSNLGKSIAGSKHCLCRLELGCRLLTAVLLIPPDLLHHQTNIVAAHTATGAAPAATALITTARCRPRWLGRLLSAAVSALFFTPAAVARHRAASRNRCLQQGSPTGPSAWRQESTHA